MTEKDAHEMPVPARPAFGLRRPGVLILLAFGLGLAFEIFFYKKAPGLSMLLWLALGVSAAALAALSERTRPSLSAIVLLVLLLALGAGTYLRLEPLSVFLDIALALMLFVFVARLLRHDQLGEMGWLDMGWTAVSIPVEAWLRPWPVIGDVWSRRVRERGSRRVVLSILRGLALALPVLVVFGALLGTADLVFGDILETALRWLDLERLADWAARGIVISAVGLFCLGILAIAYRPHAPRPLYGKDRPLLAPFLGFTEAAVTLGAVDLLFLGFVGVQFAYLFGGEANIYAAGYTYAEYARRGFGELVAVGFLSLGLIYALAAVTRRPEARSRRAFAALSALLVLLVLVMLVSAWQRLSLYEGAYGFSRLRTYTHVALPWLGLAFAAFLILLLSGRLRAVAPVGLALALGFTLSLNAVNVDAFIASHNIQRMEAMGDLDVSYLLQLSDDAVPALANLARGADEAVRADLLPQLACRRATLLRAARDQGWLSSHASRSAALRSLDELNDLLEPYRVLRAYDGRNYRLPTYRVYGPEDSDVCLYTWD
ncbi:MAG TPA: DUF4173 domain-containing protein [Anaerolineales bacterium]|nr:DUF4173 domain-containing protein [Anaerolineales bacterium]